MADKAAQNSKSKSPENKTPNKQEKKNDSKVISIAPVAKPEKQKWTLQRCQKYARRHSDEKTWVMESPSSYKAAVAHGWLKECLTAMKEAHSDSHMHSHKKAA